MRPPGSAPVMGYIQHHQYLADNAGDIFNKCEIFQWNEMREILLKVDHGPTYHLNVNAFTQMCKSTWICLLMTLLAERTGSLTFHKTYAVEKQ